LTAGTAENGNATSLAPTPGRVALTLALGTLGGWAAFALQFPLAWMIGAMTATTLAAAVRLPVALAPSLRGVMVAVLGVMLGSGFSPEILAAMADWWPSLGALALYAAAAGGAGWFYFRRVWGYDPVTAYFAAMPGGLTEMVLVGGALGGDPRVISLSHASRLLLVVLALPFAFQLLAGYQPAARPAAGLPLLEVAPGDLALLAVCALVGFTAARALRLPAAALIGPMVLSAAVHLAGWTAAKPPLELVAAAQVVVGGAIGARFAGASPRLIGRALTAAVGATAVLLGATLAFALALAGLAGLPVRPLILAFSPGGLAEMSLIALAIGADAAFVATHHIVRICLIVLLAPAAFRLLVRRARP
jgi:membrane AbrB-like protein